MNIIPKLVIPIVVLIIIINGLKNKVDVYNSFLIGIKDGLKIVLNIFPSILAMMFAVNIFLNSGVINVLTVMFNKTWISNKIPFCVLPMTLLRPISGTASLTLLNSILESYGPDSYAGRLASVLQGCTDTTIYVLALYFGSIKITKTRYALPVGLFADLVGIVMAVVITKLFFGI